MTAICSTSTLRLPIVPDLLSALTVGYKGGEGGQLIAAPAKHLSLTADEQNGDILSLAHRDLPLTAPTCHMSRGSVMTLVSGPGAGPLSRF